MEIMNPRRVLGKGLSALIQDAGDLGKIGDRNVCMVGIEDIEHNPKQPRKSFDDSSLQDLSDSINQVGVLQPILVRKQAADSTGPTPESGAPLAADPPTYRVVAGERRLRAARMAGIREIPAIVCSYQDTEALKIALLENIQREDLNPLEEAQAFQSLLEAYGATQEELAAMLGKNRSSVTNTLRLLSLEPEIQTMLSEGHITRGHAKALLGLPNGPVRVRLAKLCRSRGLSVRECERRVQVAMASRRTRSRRRRGRPETPEVRALRERAEQRLGSPVRIERDPRSGKGTLTIRFFSDEDLERVLEVFGVNTDLS
jgi:ParB family chromosome partitioning protein